MSVARIVQPRDFIGTAEGLWFAVVAASADPLVATVRYRGTADGWQKLTTEHGTALLRTAYPHYLLRCPRRDAWVQAVAVERIRHHLQPRIRLHQMLAGGPCDALEAALCALVDQLATTETLRSCLGVTGSLLLGAHGPQSDLDLVVYGRAAFHQLRVAVAELTRAGRLQTPTAAFWQAAYARRAPTLSYAEYVYHEQRKHNHGSYRGVKFDLSLIAEDGPGEPAAGIKLRPYTLRARVCDDRYGFDTPALFRLDHSVRELWVFTQTYVGQARVGEWIEARGWLELDAAGALRLVVGSSREARREYVKTMGTKRIIDANSPVA